MFVLCAQLINQNRCYFAAICFCWLPLPPVLLWKALKNPKCWGLMTEKSVFDTRWRGVILISAPQLIKLFGVIRGSGQVSHDKKRPRCENENWTEPVLIKLAADVIENTFWESYEWRARGKSVKSLAAIGSYRGSGFLTCSERETRNLIYFFLHSAHLYLHPESHTQRSATQHNALPTQWQSMQLLKAAALNQ